MYWFKAASIVYLIDQAILTVIFIGYGVIHLIRLRSYKSFSHGHLTWACNKNCQKLNFHSFKIKRLVFRTTLLYKIRLYFNTFLYIDYSF